MMAKSKERKEVEALIAKCTFNPRADRRTIVKAAKAVISLRKRKEND
jgi:hypothetical protein